MYQGNFEKLDVWKKSHLFVLKIYKVTKLFPNEEKFSLTDQVKRSALSIAANIVEGNEKRTRKDFTQFLYISKASLAETKYHLILAKDLYYIKENTFYELLEDANEIGRLINGLIKYLSNSP